jgi:WD40 repeat protein
MNDIFTLYLFNSMRLKASRFLLLLLLLAGMVSLVSAWCEKTHFFEQTGNRINEIDISPDRSMLVTAGDSKRIVVWNFTTLQPIFNVSVG